MKWAWTLGTVAGTKVRIHVTFLFLLVFVAVKFWSAAGPRAAAAGVGFFLAVFFCVVLHEFGHALAARRFGIRTPDITLYPIGGIARLERMPQNPLRELVVAAAGPAVNVAIAVILLFTPAGFPSADDLGEVFSQITLPAFLGLLMWVNIGLVIFNLIPAFPMDGGRMLRAVLAMVLPRPGATRLAATLGQVLAVVGAVSFIYLEAWIPLLIAIFVFVAAGREAAMTEARARLESVPVRAAMETRFQILRTDDSLAHAAEVLLQGSQRGFPVVDRDGTCCGLLLRTDLMRALADGRSEEVVGEVAQSGFPMIVANQSLARAVESLRETDLPAGPVIDESGRIEGMLTRENAAGFATVRFPFRTRRRG